MTTYIDLASLGPTDEVGKLRARLLGLEGYLVPKVQRPALLRLARTGDVIRCRPSTFVYWRRLPPGVGIVSTEDYEDSVGSRVDDRLVWSLTRLDVPVAEARRLVSSPPKTERHGRWEVFGLAQQMAQVSAVEELVVINLPELEFLGREKGEDTSGKLPYRWQVVGDDVAEVKGRLKEAIQRGEAVGLDVETDLDGTEPDEMRDSLVGVALAFGDECYYGEVKNQRWISLLCAYLSAVNWCGFGAKYDMAVLERHGIEPGLLVGDGLLALYLKGHSMGLKEAVGKRYGVQMETYLDVVGGDRSKPISTVEVERTGRYCCGDSYWALGLERDEVRELGEAEARLYREVDLPLVRILVDMQLAGIGFDRDGAVEELEKVEREAKKIAEVINDLAFADGYIRPRKVRTCSSCHGGKNKRLSCEVCGGEGGFPEEQPLNPGSRDQLSEWFHDTCHLPVQRVSEKTARPSLNALSLLRLRGEHQAIGLVLSWRKLRKYAEYLEDWIAEARPAGNDSFRIHTTFTNSFVRSGRLSSRNPNLQQVSLSWRGHFRAPEGRVLVAADYAQLEIRVAAYLSHDPILLGIVNAPPDSFEGDVHAQTMLHVFGIPRERQREHPGIRTSAKAYLFGRLYGANAKTILENLEKAALAEPELEIEVPSEKEVGRRLAKLDSTYAVYFQEYRPAILQRARDDGGLVRTAWRRPRLVPDLFSPAKDKREAAERVTVNHTVQGTAADIVRFAMKDVSGMEGGRLLLQVHDELLSEVDAEGAMWYSERMREAMLLGQPLEGVPLVVDVGIAETWEGTHK